MPSSGQTANIFMITIGIIGVFGIITFALAAATLGTLNKRYSNLDQDADIVMGLVREINARLSSIGETSEPSTAQSTTTTTETTTTTTTATTTTTETTTTTTTATTTTTETTTTTTETTTTTTTATTTTTETTTTTP
ncbi:unnamed protein product [Rotaria socialis]|uniref:Uncharacterized protein n=1 Tax=Rotaria socialis TaxID=392032 RepID=A0A820V560_9BILA|nr:unnamed protein product [Rotaria socialis]CAF4494819.1 unnamed protein product [Rotaria socialis]